MTDVAAPAVPRFADWMNERTKGRPTPAGFLRFHRWIYQTSEGRFGHGMIGAPCLILTTTGRRSRKARPAVLVYAKDGEGYVLAASNDGLENDPGWLFNVRAEPAVKLRVARQELTGIAQVVESFDPDYRRLWALLNATNHARYDGYQTRTKRPIPIVVIEPTSQVLAL
jgi:deazaflavin-dependent oxidoreductase (nitroreductase family)